MEEKNLELETALTDTQEQLAKEQETARLMGELSSTSTTDKVRKLKDDLKRQRECAKHAWCLNYAQVNEQEKLLAKREDEIAELKEKLKACLHESSQRSHSCESESDPSEGAVAVHVDPVKHRGKAPPIDVFDGENAEIRFKDWLPSLE